MRPQIKHAVYFKLKTISVTEPRGKQMPVQFHWGDGQMFQLIRLLCAVQTYCGDTFTLRSTHYPFSRIMLKRRTVASASILLKTALRYPQESGRISMCNLKELFLWVFLVWWNVCHLETISFSGFQIPFSSVGLSSLRKSETAPGP